MGGTDKGAALAANFNWKSGFPDNDHEHISTRLVKSPSQAASGDYAIPTHELVDIAAAKKWIAQQGQSEFTLKPDVGFLGKDTSYYSKEELFRTTLHFFLYQPLVHVCSFSRGLRKGFLR